MAEVVYILCAVLSLGCSILLFRGYRKNPSNLLFWSGLCFAFLTCSNVLLVIDMMVLPDVEFYGGLWRVSLAATAGSLLLFGLIWELT